MDWRTSTSETVDLDKVDDLLTCDVDQDNSPKDDGANREQNEREEDVGNKEDSKEKQGSLQRINYLSRYVSFRDDLEQTRVHLWKRVKDNMCLAMLAQGDDLQQWIYALNQYIEAFDFAFTKPEHVLMIEMCWKVSMEMEHDFDLMNKVIKLTVLLLSKPSLITRQDLQLDWRQLNSLFKRLSYSAAYRNMLLCLPVTMHLNMSNLILNSRLYYSKESAAEMLTEWAHLVSPYSQLYTRYISLIVTFMPIYLPPEEHEFGFKLWFDYFMKIFVEMRNQDHSKLMYFFASVAKTALGFIDWEPYMAVIFQYFRKMFTSKTVTSNEIVLSARWIVHMITAESSCLSNLEQLLQIFFVNHKKIICYLMSEFTNRLHKEKSTDQFWYELWTPQSCYLTQEVIGQFSRLMVKHYEKIYFCDFEVHHLYNLCLICPEELARQSVEKYALAQERIFEPNRFKLALQMYSVSLFPIVADEQVGPQHRTTVISTLTKLIKSINTNDQTLCFLHLLTIRSIVVFGIPLEDCSRLNTDGLDEHSTQLVKDSVQLEQFPSDFVQLCFKIIECNNEDLFNIIQQGLSLNCVLFDILLHVLANVSQDKFMTICDQVVTYCTSSIIESKRCCRLLERLLIACLLSDHSGNVFSKLFTSISTNLLSSIEGEHSKYSDICQSEFIYNWRMLHACFAFNGKALVPYQDKIICLLKRIYQIDFEDNFEHNNMITDILSYLFFYLTNIYSLSHVYNRKLIKEYNKEEDDKSKLAQLTDFPVQYRLKELPLEWHVPDKEEIEFAKALFAQFIKPEMTSLEQWTTGQAQLSSAQVEKSLGIVLSFLGCTQCLPSAGDSMLEDEYFSDLPDSFAIDLFKGQNFREDIILLTGKILDKLKDTASDNVGLIGLIVEAIDYSLFPYISVKSSSRHSAKYIFHPLSSVYSSLPIVQYSSISAYQVRVCSILKRWTNRKFTNAHQLAIFQLLDLATCDNAQIRISAQVILLKLIKMFRSKVVELILPQLLDNLRNVQQHDAFEATLSLLVVKGKDFNSILISSDLDVLAQLWPTLVEVNNAEKPRIAKMIDSDVRRLFASKVYVTRPIQRKGLQSCLEELLLKASEQGFQLPSSEETGLIDKMISLQCEANRLQYKRLVLQLVILLKSNTLHWRFFTLGFLMLQFLIQHDTEYLLESVQFTLDNLVHDSLAVRQWAIWGLKKFLFTIKQTKVLHRASSEQFDSTIASSMMDCLSSREIYESTLFYDKTDYGFGDEIAQMYTEFVPLESSELSKYQFITDKFCDDTFLDKLFHLHSVDETKRQDINVWKAFKHLFGTFGLFNCSAFFTRIESLFEKKKYNYDKFALTILLAMVKASPRYDYDQLMSLKQFLHSTVFDHHFDRSFNKESYDFWYYFFQAMFKHRDLRRFYWVFEHFFNERLFDQSSRSAYNQSCVVYFISTGLSGNWKYEQVNEKVLNCLESNLTLKYKTPRLAVSRNLQFAFHYRIQSPTGEFVRVCPSRSDFIQRMYDRLHRSMSPLFVSSNEKQTLDSITAIKSAIFDFETEAGQELYNLIDTICLWIRYSLADKKSIASNEFGMLFPILSLVQTKKEELQSNVKSALSFIQTQTYQSKDIDSILPLMELMADNWNWHSRKLVSLYVHNFIYNNLFVVKHSRAWMDRLYELTLRLLRDEVLEVRQHTMITLRDLLKWNVLDEEAKDQLIKQCKGDALNCENDLVVRHSAILGLCAFVYAYSYEMNDHLADVVLFLAKRLSDPQPIQKTVSLALRSFKKTHKPYWIEHKKKFTEEQLVELSNVLVSSSCFA